MELIGSLVGSLGFTIGFRVSLQGLGPFLCKGFCCHSSLRLVTSPGLQECQKTQGKQCKAAGARVGFWGLGALGFGGVELGLYGASKGQGQCLFSITRQVRSGWVSMP